MPTELPMIELVFKQLRGPFIQIDIDFISKVGSLYLETISLSLKSYWPKGYGKIEVWITITYREEGEEKDEIFAVSFLW